MLNRSVKNTAAAVKWRKQTKKPDAIADSVGLFCAVKHHWATLAAPQARQAGRPVAGRVGGGSWLGHVGGV